jgi:hypothetical protein
MAAISVIVGWRAELAGPERVARCGRHDGPPLAPSSPGYGRVRLSTFTDAAALGSGPVVVEQDVTGFIAEGLQDLKDVDFIHHDQVLGESADLGLKTT